MVRACNIAKYRYLYMLVIKCKSIYFKFIFKFNGLDATRLIKISIRSCNYNVDFADGGITRATSRITSRALDKKQISIANLAFHKRLLSGMQSSQLVLFLSPISLIVYLRSCCNGRLCNCC